MSGTGKDFNLNLNRHKYLMPFQKSDVSEINKRKSKYT